MIYNALISVFSKTIKAKIQSQLQSAVQEFFESECPLLLRDYNSAK